MPETPTTPGWYPWRPPPELRNGEDGHWQCVQVYEVGGVLQVCEFFIQQHPRGPLAKDLGGEWGRKIEFEELVRA